ncbi:MAG TPA: COR domain-containing protein [Pirellulales bacterium]|nr:COR domain-containing protein [Pirellulales bacterium]
MARDNEYAERCIDEARGSGATTLNDLRDLKLTQLPESIGHLTELQTLDLSGNQLTALPESIGRLTELQQLDLSGNQLTALPKSLGQLKQLQSLNLDRNKLMVLPESLGKLMQLQSLKLCNNQLTVLPMSLGRLTQLSELDISANRLSTLPEWLGKFTNLRVLYLRELPTVFEPDVQSRSFRIIRGLLNLHKLDIRNNALAELSPELYKMRWLREVYLDENSLTAFSKGLRGMKALRILSVSSNRLTSLPIELAHLKDLNRIIANGNPLNPELAAAYDEGIDGVKRYLRAKGEAQVVLNEAKLILIGEGEVGKSCLLGALRDDPWEESRPTTHGIEIKPVRVTDPGMGTEITLNGWDFGGQRVYRPTHQLFFSAPAVYLVVWKPREGPQQGLVWEWIKLVKHREPDAKILVVATHGGPGDRQPDIDRQEIWDAFSKESVIDFFHVDSRPPQIDEKTKKQTGTGTGIKELRLAIARVAAALPEVGRTFPAHWQKAREALRTRKEAYLSLERVFEIYKEHRVGEEDSWLLLRICQRVGDLIHFEHDPILRDIVILKPDWLATAISYVLDDQYTREKGHGLVEFSRLGKLWNDSRRKKRERYSPKLHPVFLRLMERFDLSYRVAELGKEDIGNSTSLIAQLVPDIRPEPMPAWGPTPSDSDTQQVQICRIVETSKSVSANAEGLFYQLIVRLHKYSLGRADYQKSVHWQRGLVLEDDMGARALLEHIGNDVRITVRSPYPERFLSALTYEVKWLVESFWEGLRCEVTVPCLTRHTDGRTCNGLFEVAKLIENKGRGRDEQPCPICNDWHKIESLLHNAPAARRNPIEDVLANQVEMGRMLEAMRDQLGDQHAEVIGRFDFVDSTTKIIVSKVEDAYTNWLHLYLDEVKEGPRLFSFEPIKPGFFAKPKWISAKFKLSLWCEHSRVPLWTLSSDKKAGVYTLDLPREWLMKAAPFLKVISGTLGLVLPVVAAGGKVVIPESDYKGIESELGLGKATAESLVKGGGEAVKWLAKDEAFELGSGTAIRADGAVLRQLHAWLREKDPSFGGLVRVMNRRHEFLWVHPQYAGEY